VNETVVESDSFLVVGRQAMEGKEVSENILEGMSEVLWNMLLEDKER
jgi:hypothetical protein